MSKPWRYGRRREDGWAAYPPPVPSQEPDDLTGVIIYAFWRCAKHALLPVMVMLCILVTMGSVWWLKLYLIAMNSATLYMFYSARNQAGEGAGKMPVKRAIRLHLMTVAGGPIGTECGRLLFCEPERRGAFRFSVFIGSVFLIWGAYAVHDHYAPPPPHSQVSRTSHP